jgi:NADH:ubiquinone oxidoreductase subunit 3 (subunit A)
MARRRRPSIPLIILFIILLLLFLLSGTIVELISKWAAQGTFTFSYSQSAVQDDPIVSIDYTLPQDLADAIAPEQVEGWAVTLADNVLSLTDGTLDTGESVTVGYRLTKYIKGGARAITATGTTEAGITSTTESSLLVPEVVLLALATMLHQNAIWLLVLAIIVLVIIIVLFIIGEKKDKEREQKEESGPASPEEGGENFPEEKNYSGVNLQQGAVKVDSDWNEEDGSSTA